MRLLHAIASSVVILGAVTLVLLSCNRVKLPFVNPETLATDQAVQPDHLPDPPKVEGPRVGIGDIPTEAPFVGPEGVDEQGYPLRHPDQAALINLLRLTRTDLLEKFFGYYQEQYEGDYHNERWPADAANAFREADPAFKPLLDDWVARSPQAFSAWLARGAYGQALAWHMRGHKTIGETSQAQVLALQEHMNKAEVDLRRALELRPTLQVARHLLILGATTVSKSATAKQALDVGLAQCRLCYGIRAAYLNELQPRWGGSLADMERFAASVVPLVKENPKLGLLRGFPAAERCRIFRLEQKVEEAQTACAEALRYGDHADTLVTQANLFLAQEKSTEALASLNRALRADPQNIEALQLRHRLLKDKQDYLAAARDLLTARQLKPTDDRIAGYVQWLVKMLNYQGNQLYKAGKNAEAAAYFQVGLELDPDNRELMYRQGLAGSEQVDSLLAEALTRPDDFELRLRIDHALASKKQYDRVVAMWDPFIAAHPADPRPWYERGGAKWRMLQKQDALSDIKKACDLGLVPACTDHATLSAMAR